MLAVKTKNWIESVCGPSAPGVPGKVAPLRTPCPNAGQHGPGWVEAKDGGLAVKTGGFFMDLMDWWVVYGQFFNGNHVFLDPKKKGFQFRCSYHHDSGMKRKKLARPQPVSQTHQIGLIHLIFDMSNVQKPCRLMNYMGLIIHDYTIQYVRDWHNPLWEIVSNWYKSMTQGFWTLLAWAAKIMGRKSKKRLLPAASVDASGQGCWVFQWCEWCVLIPLLNMV